MAMKNNGINQAGNGRFITKTIYQVPVGTGGGGTGPTSEEIIKIVTTAGFIKESALADYALKRDLPDLKDYALKTAIPVAGVNYFALTDISDADHSNRHSMMMKNDDSVSGYALKDNEAYNLVMVNKWDVADFGSRGLPINLNGSKERPTYNDDKEIALSDDLERMPLICTMPFRKVSGYLGDDGKKFSKETVLGWFGVSTIAELKELVIKKPIYLMYGITLTGNPMYYYIPCQYVSFTANNKLELITDGLDTNNNKLSRYKIVLTFVLNSEATVEDTEIDITVDNYLHLPELPADASTKTYVLKSVNGVMSWVEETQ